MDKKGILILELLCIILLISTPIVFADIIIIGDPDDLAPPDLAGFNFTPTTIDTGAGPQTVTFTLHITDEMAGFFYGVFWIRSPSGSQERLAQTSDYSVVSGDIYDGIYVISIEFPRYSEAGTWWIRRMVLEDQVSNQRILSETDIIDRGFNTKLVVTGGDDLVAPELVELAIDPSSIDVSEHSKKVVFTWHITDEVSGFFYGIFWIRSPSGRQEHLAQTSYYSVYSGDINEGIYKMTIEFPEHSEAGTWRIRRLVLKDTVGNMRVYTETSLIEAGLPAHLELISDPHDIIPPQLESIEINPAAIDTSIGPQPVTFTFRVTDELAGFNYGNFWIRSPSGAQERHGQWSNRNPTSGDIFDGTYEVTIIMPKYSETGTWFIRRLCLEDNVTNMQCFTAADLTEFPTEVEVYEGPVVTPANIDFDPDTLNLKSNGKFVTVYIELPIESAYSVYEIDRSTIYLNEQILAEHRPYGIEDYDNDGILDLMVKFRRAEVINILEIGDEILTDIHGLFNDGTYFAGTDVIRTLPL